MRSFGDTWITMWGYEENSEVRGGYAIIPFAYRLSGPNPESIPFFIVSPAVSCG